MKLFAYALREYDELGYLDTCAREMGFEYGWTSEYPSLENVDLARGYDELCIITNPMPAELLDAFHAEGVKNLATRTIGYEHIDIRHAYELGMRVANAPYPPEGVANYAIMLLLMAQRKVKLLARQTLAQDFGLHGKLGKDISTSTVGVIGTGRIGTTVVKHLAGFGCRLLAYDPYPNPEVTKLATYVDLDTLYAESDAITLHAPGLPENRHMIRRCCLLQDEARRHHRERRPRHAHRHSGPGRGRRVQSGWSGRARHHRARGGPLLP
jgi:D-lactate dehydrogenase